MIHVHPHQGFLNTKFKISSDCSCKVTISPKSIDVTNNNDKSANEFTSISIEKRKAKFWQFRYPGTYIVKDNLNHTEQIVYVKDAIKLGGSKLKAQYVFEKTPWCFVVMKDRTYFYNRETEESYVEYISPDEISYVNENVVMFSNENQENQEDQEHSLYSLTQQKPIINFEEYILLNEEMLVLSKKEGNKETLTFVNLQDDNFTQNKLSGDFYSVDTELRNVYVAENNKIKIYSLDNFSQTASRDFCKYKGRIISFTNVRYASVLGNYYAGNHEITFHNIPEDKCVGTISSSYPIISLEETPVVDEEALQSDQEAIKEVLNTIKEREIYIASDVKFKLVSIPHVFINKDILRYIEETTTHQINLYGKIEEHYESELRGYQLEDTHTMDWTCEVNKFDNDVLITAKYSNNTNTYLITNGELHIFEASYKVHISKYGYVFSSPYNVEEDKEILYVFEDSRMKKISCGDFNWNTFETKGLIEDRSTEYLYKVRGNVVSTIRFSSPTPKCHLSEDVNYLMGMKGSHILLYTRSKNPAECQYNEREILTNIYDSTSYGNVLLSDDGNNILYQKDETFFLMDVNSEKADEFPNLNFIKHINGYRPLFRVENSRRRVKLIDPVSNSEINNDYIVNYNFVSPDLKLYASTKLSEYIKYFDKIRNMEITSETYRSLVQKYDVALLPRVNDDVKRSRKDFIDNHRQYFKHEWPKLNESYVIEEVDDFTRYFIEKKGYARIYSMENKELIAEIDLGMPLWFLNYVSFSYDSRYVAIAGRYPNGSTLGGLFLVYDLKEEKYIVRKTSGYAVWRTAFTQSGVVAAYDSIPITYVANVAEKYKEDQLPSIDERNFLTFSPNGRYIALSCQGYIGYGKNTQWGHQPSTDVYIHSTSDINKELVHFNDLSDDGIEHAGYEVQQNIATVSFSQDNRKLMMTSKDGTVVIRNLHLE